jgi:hypothetical protein
VVDGNVAGPYKEYKISDIGRYLLNPDSIEVKKRLSEKWSTHIAGIDHFTL